MAVMTELPQPAAMLEHQESSPTLLLRVAAGDEEAVGLCLDRFGGLVWSLARQWCPQDAEDATQEIFIEIWKSASRYDPEQASEAAFIAMIARRRLIDRLRKSERGPSTSSLGQVAMETPEPPTADSVEIADEAAKAAACMKKLSVPQQKVISLSIHQAASHAEISTLLGIPLGTVKSFARRALIQIRDCMRRPATLEGEAS